MFLFSRERRRLKHITQMYYHQNISLVMAYIHSLKFNKFKYSSLPTLPPHTHNQCESRAFLWNLLEDEMVQSEEAITLGHILLMDALQNHEAQIQIQFKSMVIWCREAECGSWGRSLAGLPGVCAASKTLAAKQTLDAVFAFIAFFFSVKANHLFRFLLLVGSRY